jgi:UDP-N-acetylmuramoyl-L-alanyl-D-glutamate--2,6-diaminopimelate ligase
VTLPSRPLGALLTRTSGLISDDGDRGSLVDVEISGIAVDSRQVRPGDLFVAIAGTRVDGHALVTDALARGAAAIAVERDPPPAPGVPVVRAASSRQLLAELAAAWHGHPSDSLRLVGITGTLGKTSTLMMLASILEAAGRRIGTVGSLGIAVDGRTIGTGFTVPDPLVLHDGLARIVEAGAELAAMEVTSHALDQERVHGLTYDLGLFTNLVPMEHADYHGSFREYVSVKRRFLALLAPGAPLVYSSDDAVLRGVVRGRPVTPIGCGEGGGSVVRTETVELGPAGTRIRLTIRDPLPRVGGGDVEAQRIELALPLLGRSNVSNATLAATAALCLGAPAEAVAQGLAAFPAPRRRMEIVHRDGFTVIDDTVGHPDSVSSLFEVVGRLPFRRLHVVFAARGQRGEQINQLLGESLAIWMENVPPATVVVTRSGEAADERNRVEDAEWMAFRAPLQESGFAYESCDRLDDAVRLAIERAAPGDLVLLLGAQGMDGGAAVAREIIASRSEAPRPDGAAP